jgi:hypothetical protein
VPDGIMVVGHNRFEGRDDIRQFYEWREQQGKTSVTGTTTTRHLLNNLSIGSSTERSANVIGIVSFYGGGAADVAARRRSNDRPSVNACSMTTPLAIQIPHSRACVREPQIALSLAIAARRWRRYGHRRPARGDRRAGRLCAPPGSRTSCRSRVGE